MQNVRNYNNADLDDARSLISDVTLNLDATPQTLNLNATLLPCGQQDFTPMPTLRPACPTIAPSHAPLVCSINLFVSPPTTAQFTLPATGPQFVSRVPEATVQPNNATEVPLFTPREYQPTGNSLPATMTRAHSLYPSPIEASNMLVSVSVSTESPKISAPAEPFCTAQNNTAARSMTSSRPLGLRAPRRLLSAPMTFAKLQEFPPRQAMRGVSSSPQLQERLALIAPHPSWPSPAPQARHVEHASGPPLRQSPAQATRHAVRHAFIPTNTIHAEHVGVPLAAASPLPQPRSLDHTPQSMKMGLMRPPCTVQQQPWISSRPAALQSGIAAAGDNGRSPALKFKLPAFASCPLPSFYTSPLRTSRTAAQFLRPSGPRFAFRRPLISPSASGAQSATTVQCSPAGIVTTPTSGAPQAFVMTPAPVGRNPRSFRMCLPTLKSTNAHVSPTRSSASPPTAETRMKACKHFGKPSPCAERAIKNQNASTSPVVRYESPAAQPKFLRSHVQSPVLATPFSLNKEGGARSAMSRLPHRSAAQPFPSVSMASSQLRRFPTRQFLPGVPTSQLTDGRAPVSQPHTQMRSTFVPRLAMRHMSAPGELQRCTAGSSLLTCGPTYSTATSRPVICSTGSSTQRAMSNSYLGCAKQVRVLEPAPSPTPQLRKMKRVPQSLRTGSLLMPPRAAVR